MIRQIQIFSLALCIAFSFTLFTQHTALAQGFKVTQVKLNAEGSPGDYLDTYCDIENLNPAQASLRVERKTTNLPDGWSASFCMVNCYAPEAMDIVETFEGSQKVSFHITWSTSNLPAETNLEYKLTNVADPSETYTIIFFASTIKVTSVEKTTQIKSPLLTQNYPNPFSVSKSGDGVTIGYSTTKPGLVTLKVYNLIGREVATIVNTVESAGMHRVLWNALDYQKNMVAPGIYIYKLISGGTSLSRRMLVTR